jgi:hypothetical protein
VRELIHELHAEAALVVPERLRKEVADLRREVMRLEAVVADLRDERRQADRNAFVRALAEEREKWIAEGRRIEHEIATSTSGL